MSITPIECRSADAIVPAIICMTLFSIAGVIYLYGLWQIVKEWRRDT